MEQLFSVLTNESLQNQIAELQSNQAELAGLFRIVALAWFLSVVFFAVLGIIQNRAIDRLKKRLKYIESVKMCFVEGTKETS